MYDSFSFQWLLLKQKKIHVTQNVLRLNFQCWLTIELIFQLVLCLYWLDFIYKTTLCYKLLEINQISIQIFQNLLMRVLKLEDKIIWNNSKSRNYMTSSISMIYIHTHTTSNILVQIVQCWNTYCDSYFILFFFT